VTVTNFGNAPARNVVVTPVVGEQRLARYGIEGPLAPGESGTVTVDLATVRQSASVTFEVGYETGDRNGTATVAYTYRPATGQIRLTGLDLAYRTNGTLEVSGNAGNTGEADVTGVIISVGTATGVEPAYPNRDYFVGTVEGSEFAPFELTASVDAANATTIPLVVNYTVDGVAYSRTVEVPYDERLEPPAESGGRVSPAIIAVGTAAMLALVGAAALGVTRWRDQNR
jgi:hypothetical protein